MSFLHAHSCEGLKSELDLFTLPTTQLSIVRGDWVHYKPIGSLNDHGPLEFVVPGSGEDYIDLPQTLLQLHVKITKADGTTLGTDKVVGPVNNWMHSLFAQIDIFLNQKLISPPAHTYAYRAYIETVLNYDEPAKSSQLTARLWYKDTAGKMDDFKSNAGLTKRATFVSSSKTVDMIGNIHHDLFNQDKFLLNGVEMRLKFIKNKDEFHLMSENPSVKAEIMDASLLVRKVRISPTVLLAHNRALEKSTAKYPMTRVDVKTITIPKDLQSKTMDNLYLGQLPKRVIIGFVSNTAFNGDFTRNPFNFQHFGLNFICLYVDGQQIPSKPLQPDFDAKQYVAAYHTLYSGTGIHFQDEGNGITREEYPGGNCLMAFDLTPDLSANAEHWNLQRQGSLRVEVRFKNGLSESINCILYAEFDNIMEIDRHRNIVVDYNN
jgi:hypothetical protein